MTYSELLAKVAAWLNRTDLTGFIPDFVELAEERINRQLRVRSMEIDLAVTPIVGNEITLAADILDVKTIWVPGYEGTPLKPQSLEAVVAAGIYGTATMFAHKGPQTLRFDGSGDVQGVLYQRIPNIATAGTTWLSTSAPSVYLFGALSEAALYIGGDPSMWEAKYQKALDEIHGNDKRYNGPLVARAR
jgi:hypothetical protein